jgi:hypothetical protein
MAHAGGTTTAYMMQIQAGELCVIRSKTTLRDLCERVDDALLHLSRGEIVTIAGNDVAELRRRVQIAMGQE